MWWQNHPDGLRRFHDLVYYGLGHRYSINVRFPLSSVRSFVHYAQGGEVVGEHSYPEAIRVAEHWEHEVVWARMWWGYMCDSPRGVAPWKWAALMDYMLRSEAGDGLMLTPPADFVGGRIGGMDQSD